MDEPTIIGRRPIGPTRGDPQRPTPIVGPAGGGPRVVISGPQPVPEPGAGDPAGGNELFAQIAIEPSGPADGLVAAAAPLFLVVAQLRNMAENADVPALRRRIVEQLRRFEERAVRYQARGGDISAARYVLCALIDEAVMTTPWGSASAWSDNSLLNQFHNETWGGEKVFQIVERVQREPEKFIALLKLLDLCLLMGFEGKYRVVAGGRERLEDLREELSRTLREHSEPTSAALSPQWQGHAAKRGIRGYLPLWMVFAFAGVVALIIFGILRWRLSGHLVPVEQLLEAIGQAGR